MTISEKIYALLRDRKMTPAEFSDRTGIARSTISDWRTKKTNPAASKIMTICEILEVTPYELLGATETEEGRLLSDYLMLTSGQKERLKEYMEELKAETKRKTEGEGS